MAPTIFDLAILLLDMSSLELGLSGSVVVALTALQSIQLTLAIERFKQ